MAALHTHTHRHTHRRKEVEALLKGKKMQGRCPLAARLEKTRRGSFVGEFLYFFFGAVSGSLCKGCHKVGL